MGAAQIIDLDFENAAAHFEVSATTDLGRTRRVNEDSFVAAPPVFVVADGMGGHSHGDRASQAVASVFQVLGAEPTLPSVATVLAAVRAADAIVQGIGGDAIAGTTLAGIALTSDPETGAVRWMAFNIGDSRVYRWLDSALIQLSVDHSAVQELVDQGVIAADSAMRHPERNVITRAIGVGIDSEPDVWLLPADGEETFLICSDGLTKELDDGAISLVLAHGATADGSVADRLIEAALAAGGADNVTAIVITARVILGTSGGGTATTGLPPHLEETLPRI